MEKNNQVRAKMRQKTDTPPSVVCDATFFAAFAMGSGEPYERAKNRIFDIVNRNGTINVPSLFWYELGNILLKASTSQKNGDKPRLHRSDVNDIMFDLRKLPIVTNTEQGPDISMRISELAVENRLSFYQASYMELARRLQISLCTCDPKLQVVIRNS